MDWRLYRRNALQFVCLASKRGACDGRWRRGVNPIHADLSKVWLQGVIRRMERVAVQSHVRQTMSLWGPSNLRIRERVRADCYRGKEACSDNSSLRNTVRVSSVSAFHLRNFGKPGPPRHLCGCFVDFSLVRCLGPATNAGASQHAFI